MQRIPEALSHKLSNMAFVCACFVTLNHVYPVVDQGGGVYGG